MDKEIDLNKIKHISNGVIDSFDKNSQDHVIIDSDLDDNFKNLVYAGSIRKS